MKLWINVEIIKKPPAELLVAMFILKLIGQRGCKQNSATRMTVPGN